MRTIIGCLLAVALLSSQTGCALLTKQPPAPPSEEVRANIGTIGIVSSTTSPEVTIPEVTLRSQPSGDVNESVKRGVAGTLIGGTAGAIIGGIVGGAVCAPFLIVAPACAAMGAAYGAAGGAGTGLLIGGASGYLSKNETQATAASPGITREAIVANANEALTRAHPREEIRDQVYRSVQTQTTASTTLLAYDVTAQRTQDSGVETLLELTLTKIGLAGDRVSLPSSPATPYLTVRSRLIRASDNQVLYTNSYEHQGRSRAVKEWDEVEPWQQFLSESAPPLADQIVRHLFLTEPPTDWMETTKSALPKLGNTVSSWFRSPSAGKTDESDSAQNVAASKVEARDESKEEADLKPAAQNQTAGIGWLFTSIKERIGIKAQ
jgi:hypothetical protein